MKYLAALLCLLFVPLSVNAEQPQRKVIKPPVTVRPQLPQGFGRPIQRPPGFGKQGWQKTRMQQLQVQRNHRQSRIIIGNQYHVRTYHYRVYRPSVIHHSYGPPVIVQPQPVPIYPTPYGVFFFQFRF